MVYMLTLNQHISAQNLYDIQLQTLEQNNFRLDQWQKNKFTVVIFLLADCPACQSYTLTLNALSSKYKQSGVAFYGIFPGKYGTTKEDLEFKHTYKINFPLLLDPTKILVNKFQAKVAPQVFVLNQKGSVIYRGRIDDWMYAVGKKKMQITSHDLNNALNEAISNKAISKSVTTPIGCIIE